MSLTCEACGCVLPDVAAVRVAVRPESAERPESDPEAESRLRGHLFQELDILAFALEMEAAQALERGAGGDAERAQQTRLGIRLAQRLVGAVPAPEVDRRIERWRRAYLAKFPG